MFAYQDIITGIKIAAKTNPSDELSHCQLLDRYSRDLGFQSYHHLQSSLKAVPKDNFGKISNRIMRQVCTQKLPIHESSYFEFSCFSSHSFSYYSYWIGWDRSGNEVRVPRPLHGADRAQRLREVYDEPLYILESDQELLAWMAGWRGRALIHEPLTQKYFSSFFKKEHLVEKNPNIDLVRSKCAQRLEQILSK